MEPHRDTSPSACANVQYFRNQAKTYLVFTVVPTLCVNHNAVVLMLEKGGDVDFLFNPEKTHRNLWKCGGVTCT